MASREDPVSMLHHVQYEIRHCMLIPEWRDEADILKEAIFLSFFVHARVLIHFFEDTHGRPDDIFSSDFGFSPVKLALPPDVNMRFGKDIMHITLGAHLGVEALADSRNLFSNQTDRDRVRRSCHRHIRERTSKK